MIVIKITALDDLTLSMKPEGNGHCVSMASFILQVVTDPIDEVMAEV